MASWVQNYDGLFEAILEANRISGVPYEYGVVGRDIQRAWYTEGIEGVKTLAENHGISYVVDSEGYPLWFKIHRVVGATEVSAPQVFANALEAGEVIDTGEIVFAPMAEVTTTGGTTIAGGAVQTLTKALPVIGAVATGIGLGYESYKKHPEAWTDLSNALVNTEIGDTPAVLIRIAEGQYTDEALSYAKEEDVARVVKALADRNALNGIETYTSQIEASGTHEVVASSVSGRTIAFEAGMRDLMLNYPSNRVYQVQETVVTGESGADIIECSMLSASTPPSGELYFFYDDQYGVYEANVPDVSFVATSVRYTASGGIESVITQPTSASTIASGEGVYRVSSTQTQYVYGGLNVDTEVIREDNPFTRAFPYIPSTLPFSASPNMSLADITQKLRETYPDWYNESFTVGSYNPATGEIEDTRYYPLAMPTTDVYTSDKPETGYNQRTAQEGKVQPQEAQQTKTLTENMPDLDTKTPAIPSLPTPPDGGGGDVTGTSADGLYSVYNPTPAQITQLGQFLWSDNIVDILKTFLNNPMEAIISLHLVYCTPDTSTPQPIYLGYINTLVHSKVVSNQFKTINCGNVEVAEYFKDARDYCEPYTKVEIYLPFIGMKQLHTADIIGGVVNVVYTVDVFTGALLCKIFVTKLGVKQLLYCFSGNCSVQVPLTGADRTRLLSGVIAGVTGAVTGGAGGAVMGSIVGGLMQGSSIDRSGSFSANSGALGVKIPYIIITRKYSYNAGDYNKFYGYPSNNKVMLGVCKGYTRVKDVHVDLITIATENEKKEIEALLKSGVIIN